MKLKGMKGQMMDLIQSSFADGSINNGGESPL